MCNLSARKGVTGKCGERVIGTMWYVVADSVRRFRSAFFEEVDRVFILSVASRGDVSMRRRDMELIMFCD